MRSIPKAHHKEKTAAMATTVFAATTIVLSRPDCTLTTSRSKESFRVTTNPMPPDKR